MSPWVREGDRSPNNVALTLGTLVSIRGSERRLPGLTLFASQLRVVCQAVQAEVIKNLE